MDYILTRSKRKTISISVKKGKVLVKAPRLCPRFLINKFVNSKSVWICKHLEESKIVIPKDYINKDQIKEVKENIKIEIERISEKSSLKYKQLKFSNAKTYWGFCKGDNTISLNWRLAFAPKNILEYVIIHELCHTVHKNHSARFWDLVSLHNPSYIKDKAELAKISKKLHSLEAI